MGVQHTYASRGFTFELERLVGNEQPQILRTSL
jgi:hypothetical protein